MNRWDVVAVGENSVDLVYVLSDWPRVGEQSAKQAIRDRHVLYGGQAATTISTCAALGLRATYAGATGSDENGRAVREQLRQRGVDISNLVERDVENRYAVILVDGSSGERLVLWHRDDRLNLDERELPLDAIASARLVHVDLTDEAAAICAASAGRAVSALVTTDIDQVTSKTTELVTLATHAIFAEEAPRQLTGVDDLEQALRQLRRMYPATFVVTRGSRGAVALESDRLYSAPAFPVAAVDTTGAGDVFRGGFIYAVLSGQPIERALRIANAAAAVSCTRLGAMNGIPSLNEIRTLMEG